MRNMRFAGLAMVAALATGCASGTMSMGEADLGFAEWDMDGNGLVGNDEFRMGFQNNNWFDEWDSDRDGRLADNEFRPLAAGWGIGPEMFPTWDMNQDGFLDEREIGDGMFTEWDANDDMMLDDNEFGIGMDRFG